MDELKQTGADETVVPATPPRRRWRSAVLYVLSGIGVLALALVGLMFYSHSRDATPAHTAIDEAASIESVMNDTYGKYSAAKKGWLYVGDDNITYLMQVVQQSKLGDKPEGDELYFVASGAAVDGSSNALYGAFYVHPNAAHDGGLTYESKQVAYSSTEPVRPEQVHFEALSENLWGWVIKTQDGNDPKTTPVHTTNTILAPHGDQIAELAQFPAARDYIAATSCAEAKAAWDAYARHTTAPGQDQPANTNKDASKEAGKEAGTQAGTQAGAEASADAPATEEVVEEEEEPEEPLRCDKRRWAYRIATVNGNIPVPLTVTLGGTRDGQPVEARTWKLMFDPKSFSYNVPDELRNEP